MNLNKQISDTIELYAANLHFDGLSAAQRAKTRDECKCAMLSGIALCARFFAANDGNESITPQAVGKAVAEVGLSLGYQHTVLRPQTKPEDPKP